MKFQLGSDALAIKIHEAAGEWRPMWSPDGKWITVLLAGGLGIVTPDGQRAKVISNRVPSLSVATGWSRDGKRLYIADRIHRHLIVSPVDAASGKEERIADYGATDHFATLYNRDAGLSPSRDGRTLAGNVMHYRSEIWMLEGLEPPRTSWQRLFHR